MAARNRSAAIYAAWKQSGKYEYDIKEKPLFRAIKLGYTRRDLGIYTDEEWPYKKGKKSQWERLRNFES